MIEGEMMVNFLIREPASEYHEKARTYLSSHALADFRRCPLLFWKRRQGLILDGDRPAYLLGRAAHVMILEGGARFNEEYAVGGPVNPRTGKPFGANTQAYSDWAMAQGKPVVTDEQFQLISCLKAGVEDNPTAVELLGEGEAEGVVRTEYCGTTCQSRIDWFNPTRGIVDLKTCDDLTWFEADARRYGYAHQMAFYRAVLNAELHKPVNFSYASGQFKAISGIPVHIIAVEKKEPFRCGVWQLSEQTIAVAQRENEVAIERLKQCQDSNAWPTGYEEVRVFDYV
jgi:hypothetical protein